MAYTHKGRVKVCNSICPHKGGPLAEGTFTKDTVTCPWHGLVYELATGKCLHFPGYKLIEHKLKEIPSEVKDEEVYIDENNL